MRLQSYFDIQAFINSVVNQFGVLNVAGNNILQLVLFTGGGMGVLPNGAKIYITRGSADSVLVMDAFSNTVIDTISVGTEPTDLAVTPDGGKVYVINNFSADISVIDTATNTGSTTFPSGGSGAASIIDIATNTVTGFISVGDGPQGLAFTLPSSQVSGERIAN